MGDSIIIESDRVEILPGSTLMMDRRVSTLPGSRFVPEKGLL